MKRPELYVSMSPHVHTGYTLQKLNYEKLIALAPAIIAGWFFFGLAAIQTIIVCAVGAIVAEAAWQKALKRPVTVSDGSALVSGVLLALLLSPAVPWWVALLGSICAIIFGKQVFGGVGSNPFCVPLVGWAFIQVSYATLLADYPMPHPVALLAPGEFIEYPPMDLIKLGGWESLRYLGLPYSDLFWGNVPGSIGTTSFFAVLLGGIYLLVRRIITWHIPVCCLIAGWVFALIFNQVDPAQYGNPTFLVLAGWLAISAFFLGTEHNSAPVTTQGMIAFGIGLGCLAMTIRFWGVYMEGVPFAVLLMNATTPLLDRWRPKVVGRVKEVA